MSVVYNDTIAGLDWGTSGGGGSGADTSLSNLSSTAIAVPLTFVSGGGILNTPNAANADSSGNISIYSGDTISGSAGNVALLGGTSASGQGGNIQITAGDGTSKGTVTIAAFEASAIKLQDGSEGTAGYVWTSTDAEGSGTWQAAGGGGGGANQTLSNLTSPTAINQTLAPDTDATYDIGATNLAFNSLYLSNAIANSAGNTIISINSQELFAGGATSIAWADRQLTNSTSDVVFDWNTSDALTSYKNVLSSDGTQEIGDAAGHHFAVAYIANSIVDPATNSAAMAVNARELWALDGSVSLQFTDRQLISTDGITPVLNWSDPSILQVATVVAPPATSSDPGEIGYIAADSNFIYMCVASSTWVRAVATTW